MLLASGLSGGSGEVTRRCGRRSWRRRRGAGSAWRCSGWGDHPGPGLEAAIRAGVPDFLGMAWSGWPHSEARGGRKRAGLPSADQGLAHTPVASNGVHESATQGGFE